MNISKLYDEDGNLTAIRLTKKGTGWYDIILTDDGQLRVMSDHGNWDPWFDSPWHKESDPQPLWGLVRLLACTRESYLLGRLTHGKMDYDAEASEAAVLKELESAVSSSVFTKEEADTFMESFPKGGSGGEMVAWCLDLDERSCGDAWFNECLLFSWPPGPLAWVRSVFIPEIQPALRSFLAEPPKLGVVE